MRAVKFTLLILVNFHLLSQVYSKTENQTYTYNELIQEYTLLANKFQNASLIEIGTSDIGKSLNLFIISKGGVTNIEKIKRSNKRIIFINNGIHPGEACGIDASVSLSKKLLNQTNVHKDILDRIVIVIIPVYNVGGMLNRGRFSRVNQNGPEEHGFRGNAMNLDLNRDFIKCDSKNAATFNRTFSAWDPDIFIDTHTTNGSDHQYTLTVISSQKDKQNPIIGKFQAEVMLPIVFESMKKKDMEITPYVYSFKRSPNQGIMDFLETPRFSSGYANLFNCFSFMTEAHVYKSFKERVIQTEAFLESVILFAYEHADAIKITRESAEKLEKGQIIFPVSWKLDTTKFVKIDFKGYESVIQKSEVTGLKMMFYDKDKPYYKPINYYNSFKTEIEVSKPNYYLIPQAYTNVINRLKWNKVELTMLKNDTQINVSAYFIENYKTTSKPYEAHYLHSNVELTKKIQTIQFYAGDYLVSTNQKNIRYIIETLEPQGADSFFAWNFFDGNLQQKEWFSDYAFEPIAQKILKENNELRTEFETKRKSDSLFANNNFDQLFYIYKRSQYFEKSAHRYPIFRIK